MGGPAGSTELEVMRRLGAGSYAVVYLVREVFSRESQQRLEEYNRKRRMSGIVDELEFWGKEVLDEGDVFEYSDDGLLNLEGRKKGGVQDGGKVWYGKEYAIKVLSKVGMDEEALEAQLVEVRLCFVYQRFTVY
jgi:serine/threonine protein kinase